MRWLSTDQEVCLQKIVERWVRGHVKVPGGGKLDVRVVVTQIQGELVYVHAEGQDLADKDWRQILKLRWKNTTRRALEELRKKGTMPDASDLGRYMQPSINASLKRHGLGFQLCRLDPRAPYGTSRLKMCVLSSSRKRAPRKRRSKPATV